MRNGNNNSLQMNEDAASVHAYFRELSQLIPHLPYTAMESMVVAILRAFVEERTIFVFGNGGSAASASHMMCDMNKGTIVEGSKRRVKVISLTDNVPLLTAWANDSGYDQVFAQQLRNFAGAGDLAFAISASGNSPNVLEALKVARECGANTAGIAGFQGGKMKELCDICAVVPCDNMQMIEDMHHAMLHSMFTAVRSRLSAIDGQMLAAGAGSTRIEP
jgi:D-sedoheptulose 7-phosphate isomerase